MILAPVTLTREQSHTIGNARGAWFLARAAEHKAPNVDYRARARSIAREAAAELRALWRAAS